MAESNQAVSIEKYDADDNPVIHKKLETIHYPNMTPSASMHIAPPPPHKKIELDVVSLHGNHDLPRALQAINISDIAAAGVAQILPSPHPRLCFQSRMHQDGRSPSFREKSMKKMPEKTGTQDTCTRVQKRSIDPTPFQQGTS